MGCKNRDWIGLALCVMDGFQYKLTYEGYAKHATCNFYVCSRGHGQLVRWRAADDAASLFLVSFFYCSNHMETLTMYVVVYDS